MPWFSTPLSMELLRVYMNSRAYGIWRCVVGAKELRVKEVGASSKQGIYFYDVDSDTWVYQPSEDPDPFIPREDGYYVMYFDNTKCPACRRYDIYWYSFIRRRAKELKDFRFVIILCGWFAKDCESPKAAATFTAFDVHASPTTYLVHVKNGEVRYKERYEGVLTDSELEKAVPTFRERAEKAERGEPVEKPIKEEDTLLKLLKKLLQEASKGGAQG